MFGLDEKTLAHIRGVFGRYPEIEKAEIFGSRALGTQRPNSDVDIALWGQSVSSDTVGRVRSDLDSAPTPYQFDVVGYFLIEHADLRDHIDRCGKVIYQAK